MNGSDRRVIVVTGSSRGLGRAIALRFGHGQCRILVNYREQASAAASTAEEIRRRGGEAVIFRADIGRSNDVDAMMSEALDRWGAIDVLVNNAGLTKDAIALRMDEQDWDRVMETNLKGPFLCMKSALRTMDLQRSGHVINIASIAGLRGRDSQANYAASKAGLIGLTKAAAREFGSDNIRVNCVLPGYLLTDMGMAAHEPVIQRVLAENVLGRISTPEEVASFIYHLSLMQNVSGQVFNLDSRII